MQIPLTKSQYAALIDLLYVAEWVLHAHDTEPAPADEYSSLIQHVLARAKDMGAGHLIDEVDGELMPGRLVEERMLPHIHLYDSRTMWRELVAALGERDAERADGLEALSAMTPEERIIVVGNHEAPWEIEFENYGISRIDIRKTET